MSPKGQVRGAKRHTQWNIVRAAGCERPTSPKQVRALTCSACLGRRRRTTMRINSDVRRWTALSCCLDRRSIRFPALGVSPSLRLLSPPRSCSQRLRHLARDVVPLQLLAPSQTNVTSLAGALEELVEVLQEDGGTAVYVLHCVCVQLLQRRHCVLRLLGRSAGRRKQLGLEQIVTRGNVRSQHFPSLECSCRQIKRN